MRTGFRGWGALGVSAAALWLISPSLAGQQTSALPGPQADQNPVLQQLKKAERHVSGQAVAPVFEGWAPNSNGTFNLYFGYMNRNYEEELDIPIGPSNSFEPGVDQGQPTHFLPRRHKMMFAIVVPKDFGDKRTFTWTLSIRGNTERVTGSLNPIWQVDVFKDTQTGNTPPVVKVAASEQTITMPAAATLSVNVTDDGLPKPRRRRPDQPVEPPPPGVFADTNVGLHVEWSKYRGPGRVTFAPADDAVTDGKATTKATFSTPGEYQILAVADDGSRVQGYHCCWTNAQIKVTVKPGASSTSGQP
jgi:hypothetical protein